MIPPQRFKVVKYTHNANSGRMRSKTYLHRRGRTILYPASQGRHLREQEGGG